MTPAERAALAAELDARADDVAAAAADLAAAARGGHLLRVMSAAAALHSAVLILEGAIGPAARAGVTLTPTPRLETTR